jgi:DHA3 family macrolide efflux protein-like MFS transporter
MSNLNQKLSAQNQNRRMEPFFIIWTGQAFSLLGSSLVDFAIIWWLTKLTGSAVILSIAAIIVVVPNVFLSPITGTLVDRWNRRLVIMTADSIIAIATLILALLFAFDIQSVGFVFLIMFIRAMGTAFHRPAMIASTTLMVPKRHYSRVAGLNNALRGTLQIAAPPLGALLLEVLPMQSILAIDVGTALLAIAPLLFIGIPQPIRSQTLQTADSKPSVLDDLLQGLRFIWHWPGLLMLIGVYAMVHLLMAPAMTLMPLLVTEYFQGSVLQLAWLQSAAGIGLVVGGITLGIWGGFKNRMATAMMALALLGVGLLAIGFAPTSAFPLAVGSMFFVGLALSYITSLRLAVLQASVPPEMQGRVITVALNGTSATDPIGLMIAGPLANMLGVSIWYLLGGIITLIMGIGSFFIPAIMQIEDKVHPASQPVEKIGMV